MVICETERLRLRDFCKEDIPKRLEWETIDMEWQSWDAPWERKDIDEEGINELREGLNEFAEMVGKKKDTDRRYSFELELKETGEDIGWISCYCIDDDYNYTDDDANYAFGIDIPSQRFRGMGYGYEAFSAAIEYFMSHGFDEIYTQTWSGNKPMVALAKKLGFKEICRKKDLRLVDGEKYDGLTFVYKKS